MYAWENGAVYYFASGENTECELEDFVIDSRGNTEQWQELQKEAESYHPVPTECQSLYEYKDGEFHLRLNPSDPSALWKKNAIDPSSMICSLENGFESATDLTKECNEFFSEHSVDAPHSASCDAITNYGGTITDAKNAVIAEVVVKGGDVDAAMDNYVKTTQDMVNEILSELNAQ